MTALTAELTAVSASHTVYSGLRCSGMEATEVEDIVAEEVPVAISYNGVSHAVMLATPMQLEDFAVGFTISEAIIGHLDDLYDIRVVQQADGIEVALSIAPACFVQLKDRRRNLTGRTGCGLCGAESLQAAIRRPKPVANCGSVSMTTITHAAQALSSRQYLHQLTGAVHAAAWVDRLSGELLCVREDVGRHNALDKLIGHLLRSATATRAGFVFITSRASYEMVQKAATAGISTLAAVSAPTGLAVRLARCSGVTLVGFARGGGGTAYSHPEAFVIA